MEAAFAEVMEDDAAVGRRTHKGKIDFAPLSDRRILGGQIWAAGQFFPSCRIGVIPDFHHKPSPLRGFDLTVDANFDGNIIGFANDGVESLVDATIARHLHAEIA